MLLLDHIAVAASTLEAGVAHVEQVLGTRMGPGGRHARFGTHNRLMGLEPGLYLEAIAVDPDAPQPADARWFGLDAFAGPPRLDKWILRCDDLAAALSALPMAGRPVALSRGDLAWTMAVPEDGMLPFDGLFPALLEWHVDRPPGAALPASGCRLERLVVRHPEAGALEALLAPMLDAPLVRFESAEAPGLAAELITPEGRAWLT
jgi:hypothetical protein